MRSVGCSVAVVGTLRPDTRGTHDVLGREVWPRPCAAPPHGGTGPGMAQPVNSYASARSEVNDSPTAVRPPGTLPSALEMYTSRVGGTAGSE